VAFIERPKAKGVSASGGRLCPLDPRPGAKFSKLLWKLLRVNLGKYIGKH